MEEHQREHEARLREIAVEEQMRRATDERNAHHRDCVMCRTKTASTGSGLCANGFRLFLDWTGAVWRAAQSLRA